MATNIDIAINSRWNSAGAKAAARDIEALKKALGGLGGSGGGKSAPTAIPPIPSQTRQSVVAFAQAQAAAQKATGDTAGAVKTLQAAVASLTPGTMAANRAIVSLANAEKAFASEQASVAASVAKSEKAIISEAQAMARLQGAQGNTAGAMKTLSAAIDQVGTSSSKTLGAQTQLATLQGKGISIFESMGSAALKAATGLATVAVALGGLNSLAGALSIVGDYEQELSILQATSGATKDQMSQLGAEAQALGADLTLPATSAAGAAHAMTELVKNGLSVDEAMSAAKGTLQLAAAGMISEGEAASNTAAALNAFSLSGTEATAVADIFAASISKGVRVQDMGDAIRNAGAAFAQYQSSAVGAKGALLELATATALMAQSGIKGAEAGTSLKVMLTFLASPTRTGAKDLAALGKSIGQTGNIAYDSAGKMKPLPIIMRDIAKATAGMTESAKNSVLKNIFGTDAGRAAYVLLKSQEQGAIDAGKGWDAMAAAVSKAGMAQAQAKAQMDGMKGAVAGLQSQVETLALNALLPLAPIIASVVSSMAAFTGTLAGEAGPAMTSLIGNVQQLAGFIQSAIVPALAAATTATMLYAAANAGTLITALTTEISTLAADASAWLTRNKAMLTSVGSIGIVAGAIGALVYAEKQRQQTIDDAVPGFLNSTKWYKASADALKDYSDAGLESNVNLKAAASTVELLRGKVQESTAQLAKTLDMQQRNGDHTALTTMAIKRQQEALAGYKTGLEQATTNLHDLTQEQIKAASATFDPNQIIQNAKTIQPIEIPVEINADDIKEAEKELTKLATDLPKAMNEGIAGSVDFTAKLTNAETQHGAAMVKLQKELSAAKTAEARKGIQEQIAAEEAGYAKELGAQAAAYAQQRAQQQAHIGQMLIAWTQAMAVQSKFSADPTKNAQIAETMIAGIKDAYHVVDDQGALITARAEARLAELAQAGNVNRETVRATMADTEKLSAKEAEFITAFNTAVAPREAEVSIKMKKEGKSLADINAELDAVDRVVEAEVLIQQKGDPQRIADAIASIPPTHQTEIVTFLKGQDPGAVAGIFADLPSEVRTELAIQLTGQDPAALKAQIESIPPEHRTAALLAWADNNPQKLAAEIMAMPDSHLTTAVIQMGGIAISSILSQLDAIPRQIVSTIITQHLDVAVGASPNEGRGLAKGGAGGTFVTHGPTHFTVGDNPGGVEVVNVTPVSGVGTSSASGSAVKLAGGGTAVVGPTPSMNVSGNVSVSVGPTSPGEATTEAGKQAQASADAVTDAATKAGKKLESIAVATGDRLASVEQKTQDRILEIAQKTADQLAEFDQKAAEDRARSSQELTNQIATDWSSMRASMEADDLDFFKKGADKKALAEREKEQQRFTAAMAHANEEARRIAGKGDAQLAKDTLAIRKTQIQDQIALDNSYNEAQANTKKKQRADLKKQYDEAVAAQQDAVQTQLDIAKAESEQRATERADARVAIVQQGEDEKAKVIADATEQSATVSAKAQEQANNVASASAAQKNAVIANANDQKNRAIAAAREMAAGINAAMSSIHGPPSMSGGGSSSSSAPGSHAAGGGTFMTQGPTTFTVGDNPGGVEMVSVTPISGTGTTTTGGNTIRMAGGGDAMVSGTSASTSVPSSGDAVSLVTGANQIISSILPYIQVPKGTFKAVEIYTKELGFVAEMLSAAASMHSIASRDMFPIKEETVRALATDTTTILQIIVGNINPQLIKMANATKRYGEFVTDATGILTNVIDTREKLADPQPPIDPAVIDALAREAVLVTTTIESHLLTTTQKQADLLSRFQSATASSISLLTDMADAREKLGTPQPPISMAYIQALAEESLKVGGTIGSVLVAVAQEDLATLKDYSDAVSGSVAIVTDMAELRDKLAKPHPAIDIDYVKELAAESLHVGGTIGTVMVPVAEDDLTTLTAYADAVRGSVGIINDMADLREKLATPMPPIDMAYIQALAAESLQVGGTIGSTMVPVAQEDLQTLTTYADAVEQSVKVVTDLADLREKLGTPHPAIDMAYIQQLADESQHVSVILNQRVVGFTEDEATALARYADVVGDAVGTLNDTQDLAEKAATPQPPIDIAAIQRLADESQQIAVILNQQVVGFTEDEATAFARYRDIVGGAVGILSDVQSLAESATTPQPPIDMAYIQRLADESQAVAQILSQAVLPFSDEQAAALKTYQETVSASVTTVTDVADLAKTLAEPQPPLDGTYVQALADQSVQVAQILTAVVVPSSQDQVDALNRYQESVGSAVAVLSDIQTLTHNVAQPQPYLDEVYLTDLANQSQEVTNLLYQTVIPWTDEEATALKTYADVTASSVQTLTSINDLAKSVSQPQPYLDPVYIADLANQSIMVTNMLYDTVIPWTEEEAAAIKIYADVTASSVAVLTDINDLAKTAAEPQPYLDPAYVADLANQSQMVTQILYDTVIPWTDEEAAALKQYADVVGSSVAVLKDVLDLNTAGNEIAPPISEAQIQKLADQANHITQIVANSLVPVAQEQADEIKVFAEATGASTSALKDALSLSGKLFADYTSPTDAQLSLITTDADRVVAAVSAAASKYSTDGLTATKSYADATNSIFQAYKEGLLFFQALNSGDFNLDPAKLSLFEASVSSTLTTAARLGAQAATIPMENINALNAVTAALNAEYESLINLAAVPMEDLSAATAMLSTAASAAMPSSAPAQPPVQYITNTTTQNYYTTQEVYVQDGAIQVNGVGVRANEVAQEVIRQLNGQVTARR